MAVCSGNDTNGYTLQRADDPSKAPYWQSDPNKVLQPRTRDIIETYSGITSDQIVEHIKETQHRSWLISPFASVGALTCLNLAYTTILTKLLCAASSVDCACMIPPPNLRELAYAGAPTKNLYAFDISPEFFNTGFDSCRNREKWHAEILFQADALADFEESRLGESVGKIDVISCAKFIHLFDQQGKIDMAMKLTMLLRPVAGSMFVGSQNGFPGSWKIMIGEGRRFPSQTDRFLMADADDMEEMWKEVAKRTGTEWKLESRLLDLRTIGLHEDDGSPYKVTGYNLQ